MTEANKAILGENGLAIVAGIITAYHYDERSGYYTGATEEYLPVGLGLPANSTAIAPPVAVEGKNIVFVDDNWQQVPARAVLDENGLAIVAGTITAYHYDEQNHRYTGATEEYLPVGLGLPANSTAIAPPDAGEGKNIVFINGGWYVLNAR
ncbi:hypothetical protein LU196_07795 [Pantoea sp. Mb-10]|uniref:hypothetical protein n=1 Tax=unclassified Pantoea TaxID=2630326 RepID=UPI001E60334B|nr:MULTISPECIES: hypothetical protein [unclassified Pantoea]MCE0489954.1 hypothetical protein [Pantoea sp. Mb-10]MCE0500939.1 hypothetical protein [Pantoea sp. Pb-8]